MEPGADEQMQRIATMVTAALEKPLEESIGDRLEKRMDERFDSLRAGLEARFDSLREGLEARFESLRTGVQLVGAVVPVPGDGVADADGDQMFLHRVTEALRRHKGGVIVLKRGKRKGRVKQWKYD
jgi:hypothetical protein